MAQDSALTNLLAKIVMPLLSIDDADLFVVEATASNVHLHLGGAYSGCPGVEFVTRSLLTPIVAEVFPKAMLTVSSGRPVPKGATLLERAPKAS